jgi:hypothetical protein
LIRCEESPERDGGFGCDRGVAAVEGWRVRHKIGGLKLSFNSSLKVDFLERVGIGKSKGNPG